MGSLDNITKSNNHIDTSSENTKVATISIAIRILNICLLSLIFIFSMSSLIFYVYFMFVSFSNNDIINACYSRHVCIVLLFYIMSLLSVRVITQLF